MDIKLFILKMCALISFETFASKIEDEVTRSFVKRLRDYEETRGFLRFVKKEFERKVTRKFKRIIRETPAATKLRIIINEDLADEFMQCKNPSKFFEDWVEETLCFDRTKMLRRIWKKFGWDFSKVDEAEYEP